MGNCSSAKILQTDKSNKDLYQTIQRLKKMYKEREQSDSEDDVTKQTSQNYIRYTDKKIQNKRVQQIIKDFERYGETDAVSYKRRAKSYDIC